jgi:hypothetical protein
MIATHDSISWTEPWLFKICTISKFGWTVRVCFVVSLFTLFMFASIASPEEKGTSRPHLLVMIGFNLFTACAFVAIPEFPNIQREITISKGELTLRGRFELLPLPPIVYLMVGGTRIWNKAEIKQLQLLRQREPGNRFPCEILLVTPKFAAPWLIGLLPNSNLDLIAEFLRSHQYSITLAELE